MKQNHEGLLQQFSTAEKIVTVLGVRIDPKSGKTVTYIERFVRNDQSGRTNHPVYGRYYEILY